MCFLISGRTIQFYTCISLYHICLQKLKYNLQARKIKVASSNKEKEIQIARQLGMKKGDIIIVSDRHWKYNKRILSMTWISIYFCEANISKLSQLTYKEVIYEQIEFKPGTQDWFNVIFHTNFIKEKNHMIFLIICNTVFIKILHYFMIIIHSIPERKGCFLNLKRVSTQNSTVHFMYVHPKSTTKASVLSGGLLASFRPGMLFHSTFSCLPPLWVH